MTLAQPEVSILYHEPLILLDVDTASNGTTERMTFDAFGRRFVLLVEESNPALSEPTIELLKARLADAPESWARLTVRGKKISGFIHDLNDTYIIEPRSVLAGTLITTGTDERTPSIIYRLADTLVPPDLFACDTRHDGERINGKTALANLNAEMDDPTRLAVADAGLATVGVIADSHLVEHLGDDTRSTVEQMFLTVGGIYTEQIGVEIKPTSIIIASTEDQDPVSDERTGSKLLDELADWKFINEKHLAITHLITNRSLINDDRSPIAGISFLGTPGRTGVCNVRTGASISEWLGSGLTALVIAHEIGHNFGAPHDGQPAEPGEAFNPCEDVEQGSFLMSPLLRSTRINEFSQCSIEQMEKVIAAAACLQPASQQLTVTTNDGGGGGTLHWSTLMFLIGLAMMRRIRRLRP